MPIETSIDNHLISRAINKPKNLSPTFLSNRILLLSPFPPTQIPNPRPPGLVTTKDDSHYICDKPPDVGILCSKFGKRRSTSTLMNHHYLREGLRRILRHDLQSCCVHQCLGRQDCGLYQLGLLRGRPC